MNGKPEKVKSDVPKAVKSGNKSDKKADSMYIEPKIKSQKPINVVALVKQIPVFQDMQLTPDGLLNREGQIAHMNDYCRRAVALAKRIADDTGGSARVLTMGPPEAENVCREALAFGADEGFVISDPALRGSDTLVTAKALARVLGRLAPWDLIVCGHQSLDADTGQVPPQLAEILGVPFLSGARVFNLIDGQLKLELEHDTKKLWASADLPAVVSCAERLIYPCKIKEPDIWAEQDGSKISFLSADDLGDGPWGLAGSETQVGEIRQLQVERRREIISKGAAEGAAEGAADSAADSSSDSSSGGAAQEFLKKAIDICQKELLGANGAKESVKPSEDCADASILVIAETEQEQLNLEMTSLASELAKDVTVLASHNSVSGVEGDVESGVENGVENNLPESNFESFADYGANRVLAVQSSSAKETSAPENEHPNSEDVASFAAELTKNRQFDVILAPSTDWGRETASRISAKLGCGLVGDAIGARIRDCGLVCDKPAFGGQTVAEISFRSKPNMATLRKGILPLKDSPQKNTPPQKAHPKTRQPKAEFSVSEVEVPKISRLIIEKKIKDDSNALSSARLVVGLGQGVDPSDIKRLSGLVRQIPVGAELGATRKLTDVGLMPRARQIGITGHSISPAVYIAVGTSGKFNHTVGVRNSEVFIAINNDPKAEVFDSCDLGFVGDYREVLDELLAEIAQIS